MNLSLLQLNINADNYWNALTNYLTTNDFDIISLQEVCGKETRVGNIDCKRDCFTELQHILSGSYKGEMIIAETFSSSTTASMGNALFYKNSFLMKDKKAIILEPPQKPYPSDAKSFEGQGRALLHLTLQKQEKQFSVLTTHGAWAKTSKEHLHQTKQGKILIEYLGEVPHPFIFTGDLNLDPEQPTIKQIGQMAQNLTKRYEVNNTVNPRTHRNKELRTAVDYIFVTEDIQVRQFSIVQEDLSDHLGLTATVEI